MKRLSDIAYARSGDKGSSVNIGLIAYSEEGYKLIEQKITEERVYAFFSALGVEEVVRYRLPNLWALNFLLKGVLSDQEEPTLRLDAQGKALGTALLQMFLEEEQ